MLNGSLTILSEHQDRWGLQPWRTLLVLLFEIPATWRMKVRWLNRSLQLTRKMRGLKSSRIMQTARSPDFEPRCLRNSILVSFGLEKRKLRGRLLAAEGMQVRWHAQSPDLPYSSSAHGHPVVRAETSSRHRPITRYQRNEASRCPDGSILHVMCGRHRETDHQDFFKRPAGYLGRPSLIAPPAWR